MESEPPEPGRTSPTLFLYLGRRGALSAFTRDLARVAGPRALFCISRQNELRQEIAETGAPVILADTFERSWGAILYVARALRVARLLNETIRTHGVRRVVALMPHVWSPLIRRALHRAGLRYVVIVHDATRHPGDATGLVTSWLLDDARHADEVVTLSAHVASALPALGVAQDRLRVLFHPTLGHAVRRERSEAAPPRFLFFGRIMAYKGLPLFVEACEILRQRGLAFEIGVVGEGDLGPWRTRLEKMSAEIDNRWIGHDEVPDVMARFDAVVLAHVEASQSGVAAAALGHGLPVIATPSGGVVEQIDAEKTGIFASEVSAESLADAMSRFIQNPELRRSLYRGVSHRGGADNPHSMERFFEAIVTDPGR